MNTDTIDHATLSLLVEAGAVQGAHVVGQNGGWAVVVKYGMTERPLASKHTQQVRQFKKFETLANYLKKIGIVQFDVDTADYDTSSDQVSKRPDQSEVMKRAHKALSYDKWFREQIQTCIDDPRPSVPDENVRSHFAQRRAALSSK